MLRGKDTEEAARQAEVGEVMRVVPLAPRAMDALMRQASSEFGREAYGLDIDAIDRERTEGLVDIADVLLRAGIPVPYPGGRDAGEALMDIEPKFPRFRVDMGRMGEDA